VVENARTSPRWLVVSVVVVACAVAQGFGRFTFALLLPAVKKELLGSYGLAGFVGTMNVGAYLVGTALVSVLSVHVRPARIMTAGLALSSTGLLVLSAAHGSEVLVAGMVLTGLGGASIYLPSPGVLAAVFPPERRGWAIGLAAIGIGGGIVVSSQLTNLVRWWSGDGAAWRPVWVVEGLVGVVTFVAALAWLRVTPSASAARPRLTALRHVPRWWALTAGYVTYGLAYILVMSFVVAMLEQQAHFGHAHASATFALVGVAVLVGGLLMGRASDVWGRRRLLVAAYLAGGVASATVLVGREPLVSVSVLVFGVAFAGSVTIIAAYLGDHAPPHEIGPAFAAVTLGFGVAQAVGPQLGGWLIDRNGSFDVVFWLAFALWMVGAALMWLLTDRRPPPISAAAASVDR
jgi:MFS family permease